MILNTLTRSCQASRYQIICHHFPFVCPLHLFPTESIQSILSTTLNHRLYLSLPTLVQLIFLQSAPRASQSWKYHFTTSLLPHNTKQHTAMSEEGNFLSWLANELAAHARACATANSKCYNALTVRSKTAQRNCAIKPELMDHKHILNLIQFKLQINRKYWKPRLLEI